MTDYGEGCSRAFVRDGGRWVSVSGGWAVWKYSNCKKGVSVGTNEPGGNGYAESPTQMAWKQEVGNSFLEHIFMAAVATDQPAFHHLGFQ